MTRVLVVEDEPDIALGIEHDLQLDGHDVEVLGNGEHVIDRVGRSGPFDLIVLDVGLPGKDGFEVCRDLRRAGALTRAANALGLWWRAAWPGGSALGRRNAARHALTAAGTPPAVR